MNIMKYYITLIIASAFLTGCSGQVELPSIPCPNELGDSVCEADE